MTLTCEAVASVVLGQPTKRAGAELLWHCPNHEDRHESLSVNPKKNVFLCAPCNASGTAWQLAAFLAHLDPSDKPAITALLKEYGLLNGNGARRSASASANKQRRITEFYFGPDLRKVRLEPGRGRPKDFAWEHREDGAGWKHCHGCKHKIPLYANRIFREADQLGIVLAFEGEAKADLAGQMGYAAFSYKDMRPEHCEQLAGLDVVIWPDKDQSGDEQAKAKAQMMHKSKQVRVIRMITPPAELPEAGDIVDFVRTLGRDKAEIEKLIRNAPDWKPDTREAGGFTLTPLGELLARPDTPVDYILENRLVAGTPSLVIAKPKVGKSTFARNLCLAVSRGEDFLGLRTKLGDCIYLALEEREEEVRADFRAMGADGSEPILIHAATAPSEGILALCELIRQRRPVLVVVDPLFRLAHIRDEKAYAETYAALGPLIDVARIADTHVSLTHHAGKSLKADAIDSPLGSTALGGAVSTIFVLKRTEAYRTLQSVQCVGPDLPETVLQFDSVTRRLSMGGTREEAETQSLRGEIIEFLQATAESKTEPDITEAVEGKTKFVRRALRQLVQEGKVSRDGAGRRGDPYLYRFSFSCSPYIPGTREQETQNGPETRVNIDDILVPENSPKSFLVPSIPEGPKTGNSEPVQRAQMQPKKPMVKVEI